MAKAKNKKKTGKQEQDQNKREVLGICVIALGLFFGVSMYSDAVGLVGKAISEFMFGTVGVFGYAAPVLTIAAGVVVIVFSSSEHGAGTFFMALAACLAIFSIVHICYRANVAEVKLLDYYKDAYEFGQLYKLGGGMLGALLAYPTLLLMGEWGSYILFGAVALIMFLLITRMSIKSAGKRITETIKTGIESVTQAEKAKKAALYTEEISATKQPKQRRRLEEPEPAHAKQTSAKVGRQTFLTAEPVAEPQKKKLSRRQRQNDLTLSVKDSDIELDFMPSVGSIKRRPDDVEAEVDALSGDVDDKTEYMQFDGDEIVPGFETDEPDATVYMPPFDTNETGNNVRVSRISARAPKSAPVFDEDVDDELHEITREEEPETPIVTVKMEKERGSAERSSAERSPVVVPVRTAAAKPVDMPKPEVNLPQGEILEYQRPPMTLLSFPEKTPGLVTESPTEKGKLLVETLASFGITARIVNISVGPVITRFELQPAQGVRVSRITSLSNDIALSLAAQRVRIEAPIPGKAAVGIEIPNKNTATVVLRDVLESKEFQTARSPIAFALGKDIAGNVLIADLDKMPHLLIAGATGAGKSVCINTIILSMIYRTAPSDLRLILVDPKVVEMEVYSPLPHLLLPVVTDPKKAAGALKWAVLEMENRYKRMSKAKVRDLARFNAVQENPEDRMPKIVIIIDELADLMMVAAKDVEDSICRIAQLGRACGIHLIVATQRPSADIITGLIKANIPSRIAFMVSSAIDSRVIMEMSGAEKLLGRGDMLFHANGAAKPVRAQCAFVSDGEVEAIMDFFTEQAGALAEDGDADGGAERDGDPYIVRNGQLSLDDIYTSTMQTGATQGNGKQEDELLPEAVRIVLENGQASISMIQRRLRVGYARAARLVDIMEQKKIVSGFEGSKPRKILITPLEYEAMFGESIEGGDGE